MFTHKCLDCVTQQAAGLQNPVDTKKKEEESPNRGCVKPQMGGGSLGSERIVCVCVCVCVHVCVHVCVYERERETDRQTDRDRERW